jgi:hypothetical protein
MAHPVRGIGSNGPPLPPFSNNCRHCFACQAGFAAIARHGATRFYHSDTLPYWRKRKNLPRQPAVADDASLRELASLIRNYFHQTEGRGNNCVVEPFRRGELDYFFAYPEDYSQQSIEWVNGEFGHRPHNPAFEVIYVYSQKEGSLDLNYRGSHKAIEPLQGMFATAILKLDELPPDPKDERIYDFESIAPEELRICFRRRQWHSGRGSEETAAIVHDKERRPHYA